MNADRIDINNVQVNRLAKYLPSNPYQDDVFVITYNTHDNKVNLYDKRSMKPVKKNLLAGYHVTRRSSAFDNLELMIPVKPIVEWLKNVQSKSINMHLTSHFLRLTSLETAKIIQCYNIPMPSTDPLDPTPRIDVAWFEWESVLKGKLETTPINYTPTPTPIVNE